MPRRLNGNEIMNKEHEEILGVKIDDKLSFDPHVKSLCKKAGQKMSALIRIANYLPTKKEKLDYKLYCKISIQLLPIDMDVLLPILEQFCKSYP